jgi:hypothetical protein
MSINPPEPEIPPGATPPPIPAPPVEKPEGGSIWGGVGLGCGGYILLVALIFVPEVWGFLFSGSGPTLLIYLAIPVAIGLVLLAIPDVRRLGAGVLIAAAASWLIVIGPCIALSGGL